MNNYIALFCATLSFLLYPLCQAQTASGSSAVKHHYEQSRTLGKEKSTEGPAQMFLNAQRFEKGNLTPLDEAVKKKLNIARKKAFTLIDSTFHDKGETLLVPDEYKTIQQALDAATSGDSVVVKAGIYYELLMMKDGVKLVSDSSKGGDELMPVDQAVLKLPRRTLRTVIDGSKSTPSRHGMFDFAEGLGRKTIIDGFTIQHLPAQNHHKPGHAHALNMRGASVVVINCYIRKNGSTGLGNHVIFKDQKNAMSTRDFRWKNIQTMASPVIYNNIICDNLGLGIGCNHFSTPWILGNEVFGNNDSDLGESPSPGIGVQHGAAPSIIGNIVHDNPGGGILAKPGDHQGKQSIDKPTHPLIAHNIVYSNAKEKPGIGSDGAGSKRFPVKIIGNLVAMEQAVGIGLIGGSVGIIEENVVTNTGSVGISVINSTALKLNRNKVTETNAAGIAITSRSKVLEKRDNIITGTMGPKFILH